MNRGDASSSDPVVASAGLARLQSATRMSRLAFFADFYVYPAAVAALLIFTFTFDPPRWLSHLLLVAGGVCTWTLLEYWIHRLPLHHAAWFKDLHDVHHADPRALVGTPTWFSFGGFGLLVLVPLLLTVSAAAATAFTAGLLLGYLGYVSIHYGVHHWHLNASGYLGRLRRFHALHHHYNDCCNYGVTTSFWDHVFRTYMRKDTPPEHRLHSH